MANNGTPGFPYKSASCDGASNPLGHFSDKIPDSRKQISRRIQFKRTQFADSHKTRNLVFTILKDDDLDDSGVLSGAVALVSVVGNESEDASLRPLSISIVLEDKVVVPILKSRPDAVMVLFGLLYALHLSYPKEMVQTFEFIHQLLLKFDDVKLKPKLLALKNKHLG